MCAKSYRFWLARFMNVSKRNRRLVTLTSSRQTCSEHAVWLLFAIKFIDEVCLHADGQARTLLVIGFIEQRKMLGLSRFACRTACTIDKSKFHKQTY